MLTNYPQHLAARPVLTAGEAKSSSAGIFSRGLEHLRHALCGLHGHDQLLHFEQDRMFLRCASCGHETPGWNVGTERPQVLFREEGRRERLAARPQLIDARKIA